MVNETTYVPAAKNDSLIPGDRSWGFRNGLRNGCHELLSRVVDLLKVNKIPK